MGSTNFGSQVISVQYLDAADSAIVNKIGQNVRKLGIYAGGYLTKINDTTVQISTLEAEIRSTNNQGDGTRRYVRVQTNATQNITVSTTLKYLVLRYTFEENNSHYVDMLAVSSPAADDLVIGLCVFSGSTLTGFSYSERSNPEVVGRFMKVVPTQTPSMRVRIYAGVVTAANAKVKIDDQQSPLITAPTSNPRIDLIYIDANGAVQVATGTEAASPSAPTYQGRLPLAEISLTTGQTSIVASDITDVRSFLTPVVSGIETGTMLPWAGLKSTIPAGYLDCDGSAYSRTTYAALFAKIGTQYGSGDGSTTFNVPDMRNKVIMGALQDSGGAAKSDANSEGTLAKSRTNNNKMVTTLANVGAGAPGQIATIDFNGVTIPTQGSATFPTYPNWVAMAFMIKT